MLESTDRLLLQVPAKLGDVRERVGEVPEDEADDHL
jgi:hypothetical protein